MLQSFGLVSFASTDDDDKLGKKGGGTIVSTVL